MKEDGITVDLNPAEWGFMQKIVLAAMEACPSENSAEFEFYGAFLEKLGWFRRGATQ